MKHRKTGPFIFVLAFTAFAYLTSPVLAQEKRYTLAPKSEGSKSILYHKKEGASGKISIAVYVPVDEGIDIPEDDDLFVAVTDGLATDKGSKELGSDYLKCDTNSRGTRCVAFVHFYVPRSGTYYVYVMNKSDSKKVYTLTITLWE